MAIAPLIVRIATSGAAALGRAAAQFRAFGSSVRSTATSVAGRALPAFNRLQAVLRAVASAALRAAVIIGGPLRRALRSAATGARELATNIARNVVQSLARFTAKALVLVPLALALGNAIANLSGGVLLLAPAVFAAGAALAVLKLGFEGVGDALSAGLSGDTDEYRKALKKLAPTAQEVVKKLVALAPLWRSLRGEIQKRLFVGVAADIQGLSNTYFPILTKWLTRLADHFNGFFRAVSKGLQKPEVAQQIETIFRNVDRFLRGALDAAKDLGAAFITIAEVAAPALGDVGDGLAGAAKKFREWIEKLKKDGTLDKWIQNAKETFDKVKEIGKEIGRIFAAIFKGTDEKGFLDNLKNSLTDLANWLESDEGQAVIGFFSDIAKAIANVIVWIKDAYNWFKEGIDFMREKTRGLREAFSGLETGAAAVATAIKGIGTAISALTNKTVFVDVITRNSTQGYLKPIGTSGGGGSTYKARAAGGPVMKGVPYVVGEQRPELFVPDQNGRILPSVPSSGSRGASPAGVQLVASPGADSAVATLINSLVSRGQLSLKVVNGRVAAGGARA